MKSHKIGVHVSAHQRDNYGAAAPHLVSVVSFDEGAFDEIPEQAIKIWRTHAIADHKDVAGDFDKLEDDELEPAAIWWFENHLWPEIQGVMSRHQNIYFQPTNEINNKRIIPYLRGMVKAAEKAGIKLALFGDAGGSPDLPDWIATWMPFMKEVQDGGHIYSRHAYSGVSMEFGSADNRTVYLTNPDGTPTDSNTGRPFVEAKLMIENGVYMPMVITELGWLGGWNNLPDGWLDDILRYNKLMMEHDIIVGSCLWNAGQWETAPNILSGRPLLDLGNQLRTMTPVFFDGRPIDINKPIPVGPVVDPVPEIPKPSNQPSSGEIKRYLVLERFQNDDWYDKLDDAGAKTNAQVPKDFELSFEIGANPFSDGLPWNEFKPAEARFLRDAFLPENEHDLYLVHPHNEHSGERTVYKLFANSAFDAGYTTEVTLEKGKVYKAFVNVFVDFALYNEFGAKSTKNLDPNHPILFVTLSKNGVDPDVRILDIEALKRNELAEIFHINQTGKYKLEFQFVSSYAMAPADGTAAFFINEMSIAELEGVEYVDPAIPDWPEKPIIHDLGIQLNHTATIVKLPQNFGIYEVMLDYEFEGPWEEVGRLIKENKHTVAQSHHDAVAMAYAGLDDSKIIAYGEDEALKALASEWDVDVEWRERPDAEPKPEPDVVVVGSVNNLRPLPFVRWPTDYKYVTQSFGVNPKNYERFEIPAHNGVDIQAPNNAVIYSVLPGRVIYAGDRNTSGRLSAYGYHVRVLSGDYVFIYAHLKGNFAVSEGDVIQGGQMLGVSGNGRETPAENSTGPHLHFEMRAANGKGLNGWPWGILDPSDELKLIYPDRRLSIPYAAGVPGGNQPVNGGQKIDLLDYMLGENGRQYMMRYPNGTQERYRYEIYSDHFYIVKNAGWERYAFDNQFIYQDVDTTPDNDRIYSVRSDKANQKLAEKCPRYMHVNQQWVGGTHTVQFYEKGSGRKSALNSGSGVDNIAQLKQRGAWQSPYGP
ncbi:MAG: M23 family metallopeptidase, partial [Chloroflexota bacterium]